MKAIWLRLLVISAIILIPVSYALRLVYGTRWREWEYGLVESCGMSAVVYTLAKVFLLVFIAGFWVFWQHRRRQHEEQ